MNSIFANSISTIHDNTQTVSYGEYKSMDQPDGGFVDDESCWSSTFRFQESPRTLADRCEEHRKQHASGEVKEKNIIVIHPFCDELFYFNQPNDKTKIIPSIMHKGIQRGFGVVLVESREHYALRSHELVDQGLVSRVIFTENLKARFVEGEDSSALRASRSNYFCGAYRELCVWAIIAQLAQHNPQSKFTGITDALYFGQDVPGRKVPKGHRFRSKVLRLFDLFFGIKSKDLS